MKLTDYAAHDALGLAALVKNAVRRRRRSCWTCALEAAEALDGDLNAIVRSMEGGGAGGHRRRRAGRAVRGRALPAQGHNALLRGRADRLRQPLLQGLDPRLRQRNGGAVEACRPGHVRQDQHAGGRLQRLHRAGGERPHPQPVEARLLARRLQRRLGVCGGRRALRRRPMPTTAAARSASRRRPAAWSGSSPAAGARPTAPTSASCGTASPSSTW